MARKGLRVSPCTGTHWFQYGALQEALCPLSLLFLSSLCPLSLLCLSAIHSVTAAFMPFRPKLQPRLCANKKAREKNWTQTSWFLWLLFSADSQIGVSHINFRPDGQNTRCRVKKPRHAYRRNRKKKAEPIALKQNRNNSKNAKKTKKARKMRYLASAKEYGQFFFLSPIFFLPVS